MITLTNTPPATAFVLGTLGIALIGVLTGCSPSQADETHEAPSPHVTALDEQEFVAASADGPAQNVPKPVLPDAVQDNSAEGARATVEYFWQAVDYGRLTGETEPIAQVAHYVCESCNQLIYKWEQIYADGAWAVLATETRVKITEIQQNYSEERDEEWTAVFFEMAEPASEFYQDGVLDQDASTEGATSGGWWVEMVYDTDGQQWEIDWLDYDPALDE